MKVSLLTAVFALLLFSSKLQAQQTLCDNYLNCDVTIFYEMYEGTPCMAVCSGTLTIPAGGSAYLIPDCTPSGLPCDVCIILTSIGGWAPPSNHSSNNIGHILTPYGQSGIIGGGTCGSGTPFTAT